MYEYDKTMSFDELTDVTGGWTSVIFFYENLDGNSIHQQH